MLPSRARYLVERTFALPVTLAVESIVEHNADAGVTWLWSYLSDDRRTCFCLYEAPSPEAVRSAATRSGLPVDRILEVSLLDPYPHAKTA